MNITKATVFVSGELDRLSKLNRGHLCRDETMQKMAKVLPYSHIFRQQEGFASVWKKCIEKKDIRRAMKKFNIILAFFFIPNAHYYFLLLFPICCNDAFIALIHQIERKYPRNVYSKVFVFDARMHFDTELLFFPSSSSTLFSFSTHQ